MSLTLTLTLWLWAAGLVGLLSRLPGWVPLVLLAAGFLLAAALLLRVVFGTWHC